MPGPQILPSAVDRETVDHVMQVVMSREWPVAGAVPSALESMALSLSRVRAADNGALERYVAMEEVTVRCWLSMFQA